MKLAINPTYTFNPIAQQLTLNIPGFSLSRLYAVINQTTGNQIIYASGGGPQLACSNVITAPTGTTLMLVANLAGMSPSDSLLILYEAIGSASIAASLSVTPAIEQSAIDLPGALVRGLPIEDLLVLLLQEMRLMNLLLTQGFNITDDLGALRADPIFGGTN